MPIHEFKCSDKTCGHVQEVIILKAANEIADTRDCPKCGGEKSYIIFSRPNLNIEFPSQCGSARTSMANYIDPGKKRGGLRGRLI